MSLGHPAGQTGVYRPVSQGCPVVTIEKLTERGIFAGTPAGCPWDIRPSRGFSEFLGDFSYAPFLRPICGSSESVRLPRERVTSGEVCVTSGQVWGTSEEPLDGA